ncbi:MAG: hypothetical protein HOP15_00855 [Planctomycetes bacterium]|nr:hypothetical protein [Planctomycetota bacterium]
MYLATADAARRGAWVALALAILLPLASYLLFGDRHLNISDEGFLWYGVQRTAAGEVPMRDFQAYDPGRYHWCAALAPLFGDGILGVRAASAVFQGLGLLCALLVARRVARGVGWQLFVGLVLMLWMFPRHKQFEPAIGAMAAWFAVRLLERPSTMRHLATGVFVGLAGYFGRNLGLYCGLATGVLVLLLAWKQREPGFARRAGAWTLGVGLGYSPMLVMFAFVPGFAQAFGDSLRLILEHGANVSRPWPWPWRVESAGLSAKNAFRDWMTALAFLLPVLALPGLLFAVVRTRAEDLKTRAACLAPAVVALFFVHHASVNSGAWHLAQSSPPLVLALLALPQLFPARRGAVALVAWCGLALVTLGFSLSSNPDLTQTLGQPSVEHRIGRETLKLQPRHASLLAGLEAALARTVGDEPVFLAPNIPSFYCVLGKRSPSWWLFFFWEATPEEEQALLQELGEPRVDWALVFESPRDVQDRRFSDTHPLVWQHFETQWRRVPAPGLPPDFVLFRRR